MPRLSSADGSKRTHVGHGASCGYSLRVCHVPHGDEAHHCRRSALSWSVSHIGFGPQSTACCPPVEFRAKRRSVHGEIILDGGLYSVIFEMGWRFFLEIEAEKEGSAAMTRSRSVRPIGRRKSPPCRTNFCSVNVTKFTSPPLATCHCVRDLSPRAVLHLV